jgi:hypothetical protein
LIETEDDKMGGMVPLGDASRLPARVPVVTAGIIVVNVVVFSVARVQTGGVAYLPHISDFIFGAATARLFEGQRQIA